MKFTGKAKALAGTAITGAGIVGASSLINSGKNNEIIFLEEKSRNSNRLSFIQRDNEDWRCEIIGNFVQKNPPEAIFLENLKDSLSNYLEKYEHSTKIKEEFVKGFKKSCFSNSSEDIEHVLLLLNLQKIEEEWKFSKEDLEKVFNGSWTNK